MSLASSLRKTNLGKETLPVLPCGQSMRKVYYAGETGFMSQMIPLCVWRFYDSITTTLLQDTSVLTKPWTLYVGISTGKKWKTMSENTSKNARFVNDQRLRDTCPMGYSKVFHNRPGHGKKYPWTLLLAYPP